MPDQLAALVFEDAVVAMALLAPDGSVARHNRAWAELMGAAGVPAFGLPPQQFLADPGVTVWEADKPFLRDGEMRWGRQGWRLLAGADGKPLAYLVQVLDITAQKIAQSDLADAQEQLRITVAEQETERRRAAKEIVLLNNLLEERIRKRTDELQESNDDLRGFAYSLAHDLRAPLASIDGFSSRLEQRLGGQLDDTNRHYLQRVRAGVKVMADFTDALLALADLSHTELRRNPVDLSALARSIASRLHEQHPARRAELVIHETPPAEGDPRLLSAVMENLLGNAWKFSSRTESARIVFGSEPGTGGACVYHVKDNGAGFDPAYAHKLFGAFQRLHTTTEFAGTGIGLAMVRKIVSRHGGRIWAESRLGAGASFYFTLNEEIVPLARSDPDEAPLAAPHPALAAGASRAPAAPPAQTSPAPSGNAAPAV
jgi:signal transduction histidine kinase